MEVSRLPSLVLSLMFSVLSLQSYVSSLSSAFVRFLLNPQLLVTFAVRGFEGHSIHPHFNGFICPGEHLAQIIAGHSGT